MCDMSRGDTLDQVNCNPVAFDVISRIREVETPEPRLLTRLCGRTAPSSKNDKEHERNKRQGELLHDLSRYYPARQGRSVWTRSSLLSLGKYRSDRSIRCDLPLT